MLLVGGILFYSLLKLLQNGDYGLGQISTFSIFYLVGMLTKIKFNFVTPKLEKYRWLILVAFVSFAFFWKFNHHPTFVQNPNKLISLAYYYLTAFFGIASLLSFSCKYIKQTTANFWISPFLAIGKISFGIYAIHTQLVLQYIYPVFEG